MVGLFGIVGKQNHDIELFCDASHFYSSERKGIYEDDGLIIAYSDHPHNIESQPKQADGDLLWIWGDVVGHERKGHYTSKPQNIDQSKYCLELYKKYGVPFVAGLNSDFAGIIYNKEKETVSLFTDRLSSRPIYYTWGKKDSLIFSSHLQSFTSHPHVSTEFDPGFLNEFLHYGRCLGIYTPFKEIYQLPPASVFTFDLQAQKIDAWTYWWPNPVPQDRSVQSFIDQLAKTLKTVVQDRLSKNGDYGLLLSGGVDSMAVLAASDGNLTALHMNESLAKNKEEWRARAAASDVGANFRFLERDVDYYPSILSKIKHISNFNGIFSQAHAIGFQKNIRNDVDYLMTGQYSDTVISGCHAPKIDGETKKINTASGYTESLENGDMSGPIARINSGDAEYIQNLPNRENFVREHIGPNKSGIDCHGVTYPTWESLTQFGMVYPISNACSFVWYETNQQIVPTSYPYLDNRIIDIALQMPVKYRYQHDVVTKALHQLDDKVASVENRYDESLVESVRPYVKHLLTTPPHKTPVDLLRYFGILDGEISKSPRETHLAPGSWPDKDGLVRTHDFVEKHLKKHKSGIEKCPYLDYEEAIESYRVHTNSQTSRSDLRKELFSLLSLIETNTFEKIYEN